MLFRSILDTSPEPHRYLAGSACIPQSFIHHDNSYILPLRKKAKFTVLSFKFDIYTFRYSVSAGLNNKVLDVALSVSMQLSECVDLNERLNIWYADLQNL